MGDYCTPNMPELFWIHLLEYRCEECKRTFKLEIPYDGDGVVKFENLNAPQIKWLPMYGAGGYLYLFKKLIPDYKGSMIPGVVDEFLGKLNKLIEKDSVNDMYLISKNAHECIYCQSAEIKELNEEVLVNPALDWMKISCELMKG